MVTAENEEINKIMGFEMGADDYVTKPFSVLELYRPGKSGLKAQYTISRNRCRTGSSRTVQPERGTLHCPIFWRREIQLTSAEFRLLAQLVRYPARVFQRDALIDAIYSGDHAVTERSVDASIKRIREKATRCAFRYRPHRKHLW